GLPHPAAPQEGNQQALRLHLPVEEGAAFDHGEGAGADEQIATYDAHRPAAPAQLDAAGVVQLLPARRVRAHVSLPGPVRLAAGHGVATQTARRDHLEGALPALADRQTRSPSRGGQGGAVLVPEGRGHPLPLARRQHPHPMGEHPSRNRIAGGNPWSAGCSETGTSGAEGGPENRTDRKTAPRSGPTPTPTSRGRVWPRRWART